VNEPDADQPDAGPPNAGPPNAEQPAAGDALERKALDQAKLALRLACANLPHISGLGRLARLKATDQVNIAAVSKSGLILIHPERFATLPLSDAAYILAHELMHLALDTHGRRGNADPLLVNFAHDYIINDILSDELGRDPPLEGLQMAGARHKSLEELVVQLSGEGSGRAQRCWSSRGGLPAGPRPEPPSPMKRALQDAGLVDPPPPPRLPKDERLLRGDLVPDELESELEPELTPQLRGQLGAKIRHAAAKAASLAKIREQMEAAEKEPSLVEADPSDAAPSDAVMQAIRDAYHTPWQLALQRWFDAVAPGERTYARPSRRGADRTDVVLPGRRREGWTMHIVLDTSGSMIDYLPHALGAIASFCEAAGVAEIHLIQCDRDVTRDEWVDPEELAEFEITGFGYSDMIPALERLDEDPSVDAALILTDGFIDYPAEPPPYRTLWVLLGEYDADFNPGYGEVIQLESP